MQAIATLFHRGASSIPLEPVEENSLLAQPPAAWAARLASAAPDVSDLSQEARAIVLGRSGAVLVRGVPFALGDRELLLTQIHAFLCAMFPDHVQVPADATTYYWRVEDLGGSTFSVNRVYSPPHRDGITMKVVIVVLLGVRAADRGGQTFFVDIEEVLAALESTARGRAALALLRTVPVPHRRHAVFGESRTVWLPILEGRRASWRPDLLDWDSAEGDMQEVRGAIAVFERAIDEARRTEVTITPGDVLVWNQDAGLLHGRYAYSGPRLLLRTWFTHAMEIAR